jgi:DNA-binding CsgD family transcriptional regulator
VMAGRRDFAEVAGKAHTGARANHPNEPCSRHGVAIKVGYLAPPQLHHHLQAGVIDRGIACSLPCESPTPTLGGVGHRLLGPGMILSDVELIQLSHELGSIRDRRRVTQRTREVLFGLWHLDRLERRSFGGRDDPTVDTWLAVRRGGSQIILVTRHDGDAAGWVLTRWSPPFSWSDVETANRLLPVLTVLEAAHDAVETPDPVPGRLPLTSREVDVLRLLCDGLKAEAIGSRLGISGLTVRKHLEHIYTKFECHDRLLVARRARDLKLI